MKKTLALILAIVMALGCMSITAFAAEDGKSGNTTLTATKAAPFSYEISIPSNVPEITAAGVYEVGQAKVTNVQNATNNTVISYTATTTAFKLSTDESKTMAATYHNNAGGTTAFPTTAVKVYEKKADVTSIPTMWVKITEDAWNAAAAGTYTATVTYNFTAKEVVTIASILPSSFPTSEIDGHWQNTDGAILYVEYDTDLVAFGGGAMKPVPITKELTSAVENQYSCTHDNVTWLFNVEGDELVKVTVSGWTGGMEVNLNGEYVYTQID